MYLPTTFSSTETKQKWGQHFSLLEDELQNQFLHPPLFKSQHFIKNDMFAGEVGRMRKEQVELRTLVSSTRQNASNGSWLYLLRLDFKELLRNKLRFT